ncbi:MAG TPA: ChbG/HpnK family deacetylase [Trichococcus flocculiformis]|nr:ChbG/HpnK family deacetylase [Trichococcus flocculiformis]
MGQVIINADDFGLTNGVNYGIIDSFLYGITTSTTLLANGASFDHAVALASDHPELEIGVHLNLTLAKPLLPDASTISADGRFHTREYVQQHAASLDLDEVYAEWHAQIEKVRKAGIKPTHLDSHHHVHMLEPLNKVILSLAIQYELPIRDHFEGSHGVLHTDRQFDLGFAAEKPQAELGMSVMEKLDDIMAILEKPDTSVELIVHPGYVDASLERVSSLQKDRAYMAEFLMHSDFADRIREDEAIQLISYAELGE